MDEDASLRRYRDALRAYPELKLTPAGSADATLPKAESHPRGATAPPAAAFPPHLEILEKIAETNLSITWKVLDHERKAPVVLKEPRAHLLLDPDALERFRREVRLASKLSHANIVPILATHLAEPPLFFTMPLIEGEHFDLYCRTRRLPIRASLNLFLKACWAVVHAHQRGVIHRDLKPNNVLVDQNGEPHVLDFGLGRIFDRTEGAPEMIRDAVMGSPGYMAPEQAAGLTGDTRTDVYSLGVMLYQLLTGALPIQPSPDFHEMIRRIRHDAPIDPRVLAPAIEHDLAAVLLRALAKDPARRYQSVADFARDLEAYLVRKPVAAVPHDKTYLLRRWLQRNWINVTVAAVVFLGILGFTGFAIRQSLETSVARADAATARATMDQQVARIAESGRHRMAVVYGRSQARDDDPLSATEVLWREQLRYDSLRTRYALWELYQRYPCRYFVREFGRMTQVRFSPDDQWLAAVAGQQPTFLEGGSVLLFRADDGTLVAEIPADQVSASCLCFTPKNNELLVGTADGRIRSFKPLPADGELTETGVWQPFDPPVPISSLTLTPDDSILAVSNANGSITLFNRPAGVWQPHREWRLDGVPRTLAYSPDGAYLACAASLYAPTFNLGGLTIWDLAAGAEFQARAGFQCRGVLWSEDGRWLFSGENTIFAWNVRTQEILKFADAPWGLRSIDAPGHFVDRYLAAATGDGRIRFYDRNLDAVRKFTGFHDCTADHVDVSFSADGGKLASAGCDGLKMWDFLPAHEIDLIPGDSSSWQLQELALSGDGLLIIGILKAQPPATTPGDPAVKSSSGPFRLIRYDASSSPPRYDVLRSSPNEMAAPRIARDNRAVAYVEQDTNSRYSRILVFDAAHPEATAIVAEFQSLVTSLAWIERANRWLFIGNADGSLWASRVPPSDLPVEEPQKVYQFSDPCNSIVSAPDGLWLAAASEGSAAPSQIAFWRAAERCDMHDPLDRIYSHAGAIARIAGLNTWFLAFTEDQDGNLLVAAAGSDPYIHLYEVQTRKSLGKITGHTNSLRLLFTLRGDDDPLLVSASRDRSIRIWDPTEREELCRLADNSDAVVTVRNGRILLADNGMARVLDTRDIIPYLQRNRKQAERLYGKPDER